MIWFIIKKNRDVIINRAKYYYEDNKERLKKYSRDKSRNSSEEEKIIKENMEKTDTVICLKKKNKD